MWLKPKRNNDDIFLHLNKNDQFILLNNNEKNFKHKINKAGRPSLWCYGLGSVCLIIILYLTVFMGDVKRIPWYSISEIAKEIKSYAYIGDSDSTSRLGYVKSDVEMNTDKVFSCYYNLPGPTDLNQLMPNDIHPSLCTHINIAFARIVNKEIELDNEQIESLKLVVNLKKNNPNLKILLSIGGSGNDKGFSDMVVDHASRKMFIKSIKSILRNYSLDGVDLDWEFPALQRYKKNVKGKRERQHFSQLLREIRMEYYREKKNYILTIAAAAPETIVSISYDIDQVNQYVDFVNVMTYDYHFYSKYTPFTGLNAPLYSRSKEEMYMATLNINYTVHMYIDKGLDRSKIVVGIPTYGHTFTLVNAHNTRVGAPASGYGSLGSAGFVNYPDICRYLEKFDDIHLNQDRDAKVPYLYRNSEWISYDTPQSVAEKAQFIKDHNLRGAMIYSLNADDYTGICNTNLTSNLKFPLAETIKNTLITNGSRKNKNQWHIWVK